MPVDELTRTFAALADPTRRAILERLTRGDATVNELAAPFQLSLPTISKHLKVLENAQLITRSRDAQKRPCHLEAERLQQANEWTENYRRFWEQSFDRLDTYLTDLQTQRPSS